MGGCDDYVFTSGRSLYVSWIGFHMFTSEGVADTSYSSDMGAIEVEWEVEGIISAQESVEGMLKVISSKGSNDSGGFWCWDGRVSPPCPECSPMLHRSLMNLGILTMTAD